MIMLRRWIYLGCWLLAGVLALIWFVNRASPASVHVYALNGYNHPVTVFYQDKKVARLVPDEARFIKLSATNQVLEIEKPDGTRTSLGQPEHGLYLLNLGETYWVSAVELRYFTHVVTTTTEAKRFEREGLHLVSTIIDSPWQVYEFDESPPGSIDKTFGLPTLKLHCGSASGHKPVRKSKWLGPLTPPKDWQMLGEIVPGLGILFVWFFGVVLFEPVNMYEEFRKWIASRESRGLSRQPPPFPDESGERGSRPPAADVKIIGQQQPKILQQPAVASPKKDNSKGSEGAFEPGQKIGDRFTLVRFLGKGGMGIVWLARDERLDEEVALKFLSRDITHNPEALEDMRREARKSRRLSHPNIIRIHDLHEDVGPVPFISMEFIEGAGLNAMKAERKNRLFSWAEIKPWVQQLCDGLSYAHAQKVVHRDLKPANILITKSGALKLADFGIAASLADSKGRVSQNMGSSGTPAYMSPHQMNGCMPRVSDDIYALGATLYELLTSQPPFYQGDIYNQVQNLPPLPLQDRLKELGLTNEIPPEVGATILACLAKEPIERPATAGAIAERIGLEKAPRPNSPLPTLNFRTWNPAKIGMAFAILLAAAGAAVWKFHDQPTRFVPPVDFKLEEGWSTVFGPGILTKGGVNDISFWRRTPDGALVGSGNKVGVVREKDILANFQLKAEVWLETGAGGAVVIRGGRPGRDLDGYHVVLGNTRNTDLKTGSVTGLSPLQKSAVADREWFELHVIAVGNRIVVRVNRQIVSDARDPRNAYASGIIAITHKPGPPIMFRRMRVCPLPSDEAAAWKQAERSF